MKIKDIFYTNNHEISIHFVWFYIIFLILGGWVVNNFFQIEELFVIVLLLPLLGLIFYSDKKTKKFTNDNFPLFLELKKLPANLISLKQQEIFLNEFAWNNGVTFDKRTKTHIFPEKFTINDVEIFYFKELERIESERKSLEQSGEMEFQKRLISLYEAQNNNYVI